MYLFLSTICIIIAGALIPVSLGLGTIAVAAAFWFGSRSGTADEEGLLIILFALAALYWIIGTLWNIANSLW